MPWEIADSHNLTRAGSRYATMARAAEEARKASPVGRFFVRWIGEPRREVFTPIMGWQDCRLVYVATDAEMGDIYECTTHPGYTTIGHDVSCEGADIQNNDGGQKHG